MGSPAELKHLLSVAGEQTEPKPLSNQQTQPQPDLHKVSLAESLAGLPPAMPR